MNFFILCVVLWFCGVGVGAAIQAPRCYSRLESALDDMLYKSQSRSKSKSFIDLSDYRSHYDFHPSSSSEYEPIWKSDTTASEIADLIQDRPKRYSTTNYPNSVEVSHVKFRVPRNTKWVKIDKCQIIASNQTLDTRLSFPDLTIYGRVTMAPTGGHCDMILRLRRVGIDFKTSMIYPSVKTEEARNVNVRTDSYFTEPGFMSIFAHGCAGPKSSSSVRNKSPHRRINSKKPTMRDPIPTAKDMESNQDNSDDDEDVFYSRKHLLNGLAEHRDYDYGRDRHRHHHHHYRPSSQHQHSGYNNAPSVGWHTIESVDAEEGGSGEGGVGSGGVHSNEIAAAFLRELEGLFSKGAQGILTSYIQRMLQPAIKNTLMEGMGYRLSYG